MNGNQPSVALIAVHGVGTPEPGAMAHEIAGLLQAANPGRYTAFAESMLDVPVVKEQPLTGTLNLHTAPVDPADRPWFVRSEFVARNASNVVASSGGNTAFADLGATSEDIEFTRQAVDHAQVDEKLSQYRTTVLSATRHGNQRVDVYEFYWADLSLLGGFVARVLGEFYQILFHLASLGQKTVELAWLRSVGAEKKRLSIVLGAQAIAEWMLAGALPVLSLALLLAVVPVLVLGVASRDAARAAIFGGFAAVVVALMTLAYLWKAPNPNPRRGAIDRFLVVALSASAGIALGFRMLDQSSRFLEVSLYLLVAGLCLAAFVLLVRMLIARRTEGEARAPIVTGLIAAGAWILLVILGLMPHPKGTVLSAAVMTMLVAEGLFLLLSLAWALFIVAGWITWLSGMAAAALSKDWRVKAAIWTGKLGLFVSGALFFLVNLVGWHLLAEHFQEDVGRESYTSLVKRASGMLGFELPGCVRAQTVEECITTLIASSAGAGFNVFVAALGVAVVLVFVALLPSIVYESAPGKCDKARSESLGAWLDSGIVLSRFAGHLLFAALLVLLPGLAIYQLYVGGGSVDTTLLKWMGAAIVGTAGAAIAFRGALFKGVTRAVGIALDVDNWLKERPLTKNPRGRILLRYISLLRFIAQQGYGRVVIVSHSQGTVISTDLLRYLRRYSYLSLIGLPPIRLMTFGCPLRQLYGSRFPHQYEWASDLPASGKIPDVTALYAVERWTNGYRSGDYVGRYLWTGTNPWKITASPSASMPEFCLEAGAHTHYFDATAAVVGRVIDENLS